jgi:hypothetical protein
MLVDIRSMLSFNAVETLQPATAFESNCPNVFREFKGIGDGDKTIATARLEVKGNYIKDQWYCQFFASARCLTEGFQMHSIDIEGCSGVALLAV